MKNKLIIKIVIVILILIILLIGGLFGAYSHYNSPANSNSDKEITFKIKPGTNPNKIAAALEKEGIIRSATFFKQVKKYFYSDNELKAGIYKLSPKLSTTEVIEKLLKAEVITFKITIPEGYDIFSIAELFEKQDVMKKDEFIKFAFDKKLVQKYGIEADSLEGYLFPTTYVFAIGISPKKVIDTMVKQFFDSFKPEEHRSKMENLKLNLHQTVTLASLIEKETSIDSERELVSSVYYNRVRLKSMLGCDPTIIYALRLAGVTRNGKLVTEIKISEGDKKIDSPYNTYKPGVLGLPPGPIANPGLKSLLAATSPAKTKFLYFCAKGTNGEHRFSESAAEHDRNVELLKAAKNIK